MSSTMIDIGLILLSALMNSGSPTPWPLLGAAGAVAILALAANRLDSH